MDLNIDHLLINKRLEIKSDSGRALWYAIKVLDYELAKYLIQNGASLDRIYEVTPQRYLSTISLLVSQAAQAGVSKSHKSIEYKSADKLLDQALMVCQEIELRCHCSAKYEHRCPVYIAIKYQRITQNADILKEKNSLLLKLLLQGGTFKNINIKGQKMYPDLDLEGITQYILEKSRFQTQQSFYQTEDKRQERQKVSGKFKGLQMTFGEK